MLFMTAGGCSREFTEYIDHDNGFSVEYPRGWTIRHIDQEGVAINFEAPGESGEQDDAVRENFSVTAGDFDTELDVKTFAHTSLEITRSYMSGFKVIEEARFKGDHLSGYRVIFEGKGLDGESRIFKQAFFTRKKGLFSVVFTMRKNSFQKYNGISERIIRSFAFL
jgi:hypothetical protein